MAAGLPGVGNIPDFHGMMTHNLVNVYGQRHTKAVFLGNSFYLLLVWSLNYLGFSPEYGYTAGKLALFQFGTFCQLKAKGLEKRKFKELKSEIRSA